MGRWQSQPPGPRFGRRAGPRLSAAFTLLEIVLAIGLIGLLATTLIAVSSNLLNSRKESPIDTFWKATQAARKAAVLSGKDSRMAYDSKTKTFVLSDSDGKPIRSLPLRTAADDLSVDFLTTQGGTSSMLIGGNVVQTQTIPYVTFYADGTCTPFALQIRDRGGAHVVNIDPWTCAQMLKPLDQNGVPITTPR